MKPFDYDGAIKEGYSNQEIAGELAKRHNFQLEAARKEGYSDEEIIEHLMGRQSPGGVFRIPASPTTGPMNRIGKAIGDVWQPPIGPSEETLKPFVKGPLGPINKAILKGGGQLADAALRVGETVLRGGSAAAGEVARALGASPTSAKKITRDINALSEVAGISGGVVSPSFAPRRLRPRAEEIVTETAGKDIPSPVRGVDELKIPEAKPLPEFEPGKGLKELKDLGVQEGFTTPKLESRVTHEIAGAAKEMLENSGFVRDPNMRISDQIFDLLSTDRLRPEVYKEVLKKHNIDDAQFAQMFRDNIGDAARQMAYLSHVDRRLKMLSKGESGVIDELTGEPVGTSMRDVLRRMDNARRGLLVSQLATTMRNNSVSVGRIGLDAMNRALDNALNSVANVGRGEKIPLQPLDALSLFAKTFRPKQAKQITNEVLSRYPKAFDDLFMRYSSDVVRMGGDKFSKAEKAIDILNFFNRTTEFFWRRAMFSASLERQANRAGKNLTDIIANNKISEMPREWIDKAVYEALEFTFAEKPRSGSAGDLFVQLVNKAPLLATGPIPFPRFMVQALKFQYDYSPLGATTLLRKQHREAMAKGDFGKATKAMLGTAMLYGAYQFRNSSYAGERWYEGKLPDGRTIDARSYFPATPYLMAADIIKRVQDGTWNSRDFTKDVIQAVSGSQFRAGTGVYAIDKLFEDLAGAETDKGWRILKNWVGGVGSSFLVPFNMLRDVTAQIDKDERILRDVSDEPFLGQFKRKIPYGVSDKPETELATREGPYVGQDPLVRQLTGMSIRPLKNPAEQAFDRLGLKTKDIAPSTGDPEADRVFRKYLGPLVEQSVIPIVTAPFFKSLKPWEQKVVLRGVLKEVRQNATKDAIAENPKAFARAKVSRLPLDMRMLIDDKLRQQGRPSIKQLLEKVTP